LTSSSLESCNLILQRSRNGNRKMHSTCLKNVHWCWICIWFQ